MKLLKLIPDNTNIRFLRWRVPFYTVSLLLMAASLALVGIKGLNFGVDFVGGQMIRVTFAESTTAPIAQVREEIDALGYGEPIIQQLGEPNAMIGISIYIWVRFEWQFGVGALFALVHDVTLTLGLFALTGMEFDLNIVAALLTLIGYSLNDNIVVYDRIRENLKKYRRMPLPELLDLSVNETLSRTVTTSTSLLITLLALLVLGPDVIFGFTAAITLGIFVGTYSSIYMSTPILIWLGVKSDSFVPKESAVDVQERKARGEI
ncbi:MAG: protein translocase subunit SecF [Sphingomonadales bacterium 32-68-7]|nr:MAG: protein translocase subunit SecF [Sphingomonadales bacterium 32-68-7]